ncbi:MAG: hypothetical protein Ct9H300mP8_05430 [Gammaproteobacteria bacterium]|nr:MAG: hypothetical protein Ct9H300mP8_05430 [Gammaproteobacteria bacterium]
MGGPFGLQFSFYNLANGLLMQQADGKKVDAFRIVFASASLFLIAGLLVSLLAPLLNRQRLDPL